MKKILKILNTFEVYAGAFCLGVMILLLFLQVFSRYIMRHAFPWTEELALIFFILSIYFGATAAIMRNQHLRLEILLNRLGPKGRLILQIVDDIVFIAFNCIIFTGLYALTKRMYLSGARSAVTNIPKWIVYSFLPFLFMVMNIRLVQDIIIKVKNLKNGPAAAADQTEKTRGE
ncbi:MAG: TRAP transporter small permease [Treponema sp.]|jgi:TRAP-type C4-dicarboxylate transport system permease small subunit|nr:TRAP transporter small permease [Treponema sp.]